MAQIQINAGDTLTAIASKYLGNSSKWRDVAEAAGINPLENLEIGTTINLPDVGSILDKAEPLLNDISAGLNRASAVLEAASDIPGVGGYAKEAMRALAQINGVKGQATQILGDIRGQAGKLRDYQGGSVQLIDWLL